MSDETTETTSAGENLTGSQPDATPAGAGEGTWFEGFSDDDRSYLTKKGWDQDGRGPGDVLKSYRELEKRLGAPPEDFLRRPTDEASQAEFYEALGVPEEPKGYETPSVEVAGSELNGDVLAGISHALKHTPEQHAQFTEAVGQYLSGEIEAQETAAAERDASEKAALEAEWGKTKDEQYGLARRASEQYGLDAGTIDQIQQGLGYRGTIELLAKIGRSLGEGKPADAAPRDGQGTGLTPTLAKERIDQLSNDREFREKLRSGDVAAREQWDRLKTVAFRS